MKQRLDRFVVAEGRRPRMLVAKMGQDGHDRGQKVIATAFADLGFDVDVGPLFRRQRRPLGRRQTTTYTSLAWLVGCGAPDAGAARAALEAVGRPDIGVVVGGVVPPQDYEALYAAGVLAIFGPGTVIAEAAVTLLDRLSRKGHDDAGA